MHLDLDGKEVTEEYFSRASNMVAIFHESCQQWARLDDFPEGIFEASLEANTDYPQDGGNHYYWGFRLSVDDHDYNMGYSVLYLYVAVSDELGGFDLVGFYEEGNLVYLTSRVDTDWSEVWRGSYPTGRIDTSVPYARQGQFLHAPPTKED
jgi:hypothetical protein